MHEAAVGGPVDKPPPSIKEALYWWQQVIEIDRKR